MSARTRRLAVTALAIPPPVLVWLLTDPLLGHRLRIADGEQTLDTGAAPVAVVALLAPLCGWALPAALERFGARHARAVRAGAAGAVPAVSFLPLTGDGMDGATRTRLALVHLAVAAVLIPGLGNGSPRAGADAAPVLRTLRDTDTAEENLPPSEVSQHDLRLGYWAIGVRGGSPRTTEV